MDWPGWTSMVEAEATGAMPTMRAREPTPSSTDPKILGMANPFRAFGNVFDPTAASGRLSNALPEPGLQDGLAEVPPVPEGLRLLGFSAGPGPDGDGDLLEPDAVAEALDQELGRPELVLLQDEPPQHVGPGGAVAARGVGQALPGHGRDDPREEVHPHVPDHALALELAE